MYIAMRVKERVYIHLQACVVDVAMTPSPQQFSKVRAHTHTRTYSRIKITKTTREQRPYTTACLPGKNANIYDVIAVDPFRVFLQRP